jgi:hypothetical protein
MGRGRKVLIGVGIVLASLVVIGSLGGSNNRRTVNQATGTESAGRVARQSDVTARPTARPTNTPMPTATALPGKTAVNPAPFSQRLTGSEVSVELLNGRFANEYGFSEPKGGYKYLVFDVRLTGLSGEEHHYSASNFSGQDAETGAGYDSAFVFGGDSLGSDVLSGGEFVTGEIALEVQETTERVIIKYDPNMFTDDDLYWVFP